MLATLAGFLALLLGLSLLLLPLLITELSRPRDSAWGAVVLLLGLVLVTSAERLTGAPMLAVLCGGLLVGRLGGEVAQGRWRALTDEERQALRSAERWSRSLHQLAAVAGTLLQSAVGAAAGVSAWMAERRQGRSHGKRWVRSATASQVTVSEPVASQADPEREAATAAPAGASAAQQVPPPRDQAAAGDGETAADASPTADQAVAASAEGREEAAVPAAEQPAGDRSLRRTMAPLPGSEPAEPGDGDEAANDQPVSDEEANDVEPGLLAAGGHLQADAITVEAPTPAADAAPGPLRLDGAGGDPGVTVVSDFDAIDTLLASAVEPVDPPRSGGAAAGTAPPPAASPPEV